MATILPPVKQADQGRILLGYLVLALPVLSHTCLNIVARQAEVLARQRQGLVAATQDVAPPRSEGHCVAPYIAVPWSRASATNSDADDYTPSARGRVRNRRTA